MLLCRNLAAGSGYNDVYIRLQGSYFTGNDSSEIEKMQLTLWNMNYRYTILS